ncbi:MAG: hypothetical protein ACJAZO_003076 [Myxococcota bacterium]|jgi:hypothetical protein
MRTALLCLALGFVACDGGETDTDPEGTGGGEETAAEITERKFSELVTVTDALVADDGACWSPGDDWLSQTVDSAKQIVETRTVLAEDFQDGFAVTGATVNVYGGDDVTATPDTTIITDDSGEASISVAACTAVGIQVSGDGAKNTYESHQIFETTDDNDEGTLNSVSNSTYTLIPSLLGVSIDDDKSVIAGALYDCNGDPIQNAQVVVRDQDGNIPDSLVTNYFVNSFPARDQAATSEDGLWIVMNLPEGDWDVEAYVSDGAGGHDLVGTSTITNFPDTIGVGSIYWGFEGGVWYPESCRVAAAAE